MSEAVNMIWICSSESLFTNTDFKGREASGSDSSSGSGNISYLDIWTLSAIT